MEESLQKEKTLKKIDRQLVEALNVFDLTGDLPKKIIDPKEVIKAGFFEKRKFPYAYSSPVMWAIILYVLAKKSICKLFTGHKPKINSLFFDGLGPWSKRVKDGAASWRALDIIYNHPFEKTKKLGSFVDEFWWFSQNCQAVRNRFKLVKKELRKAVLDFAKNGQEVRMVSLACGSGQAMIEMMSELKEQGIKTKALLIDIEPEALDYAKKLAEKNGVVEQIDFIRGEAMQSADILHKFSPHIVEMLGLLDYLEKDNAIRLISDINNELVSGGVFLTCNIRQNSERFFVKWVIDWDMVYRSAKELAEVIELSGFKNYRLVYEPLKIHGAIIAKKSDNSQ